MVQVPEVFVCCLLRCFLQQQAHQAVPLLSSQAFASSSSTTARPPALLSNSPRARLTEDVFSGSCKGNLACACLLLCQALLNKHWNHCRDQRPGQVQAVSWPLNLGVPRCCNLVRRFPGRHTSLVLKRPARTHPHTPQAFAFPRHRVRRATASPTTATAQQHQQVGVAAHLLPIFRCLTPSLQHPAFGPARA